MLLLRRTGHFVARNCPLVKCQELSTASSASSVPKVTPSVVNDLKRIVGSSNVSTNKEILLSHGKDEGHFESMPPDVVAFPQEKEHVVSLTKYCNEHAIPIIPYGAGSGLEGGVNAVNGGVSLDMSHMNEILAVNESDFDCIVQPGVNWRQLNTHLRNTGLWFPVDPGASASLGGMAATCASGTNAVRYGTMKQNVLNVEVVLANGSIIHTSGIGFRSKKTSAGYNLTELFVGSEGTLGTFTELTLKLRASPSVIAAAVCTFPDVSAAVDTAIEILQNDIAIARMEFMDELSMQATNKYSRLNFKSLKPALFLEFHGSSQQSVQVDANCVKQIAISNGSTEDSFQFTADNEDRAKLWKARHELFMACKNLLPNSRGWVTDVCVPISKLTQMVTGAQELFNQHKLIGPCHGHVGDGNFHAALIFDPLSDPTVEERIRIATGDLARLALSLGGTCTGEHGIGRGKVAQLREQFGPDAIAVMQSLKKALDPSNIMNPGKLF